MARAGGADQAGSRHQGGATPAQPGGEPRRHRHRPGLDPRQAEVVRLMGEGLTGREIARRLGISPNTAHRHQQEAFRKLGARNRTEAAVALWAREHEAA